MRIRDGPRVLDDEAPLGDRHDQGGVVDLERRTALALSLVLVSTIAYFLSNTIFDMATLSSRYAAASTSAERASLLAAGEAALATFEGPWFTASYVLSGAAVTLASVVMWRDARFGKLVGGVGVAYGVLQLVPPNVGAAGMAMSLASLPLMLAWLVLLARKLLARHGMVGKAMTRRFF